jgi:hypothetical protein
MPGQGSEWSDTEFVHLLLRWEPELEWSAALETGQPVACWLVELQHFGLKKKYP